MTAKDSINSIILEYNGLSLLVESNEKSHLLWLEQFLSPHFQQIDSQIYDHHISLLINTQAYNTLLKNRPPLENRFVDVFAFDSMVIEFPIWSSTNELITVFDPKNKVFCSVSTDKRTILLVSAEDNVDARLHLMRIVRELAMNHSQSKGGLFLHAAAIEVNGHGIVIAGQKAAGKTTMLINFLQQKCTKYISNDRVLVLLKSQQPILKGMPTITTIRPGTLEMLPLFGQRLSSTVYRHILTIEEIEAQSSPRSQILKDGKHALSPAQLCSLLEVSQLAECQAWTLVFPQITLDEPTFQLKKLSSSIAATKLNSALFGVNTWKKRSDLLRLPDAPPIPDELNLTRLSNLFTEQVRCFECQLGPRAYASQELTTQLLYQLIE